MFQIITCYYYFSGVIFIPFKNLDVVFTYNHMSLISIRSRSHVKVSMVLAKFNNFTQYI